MHSPRRCFQWSLLLLSLLLLAFSWSAASAADGQSAHHHHHDPNALWHIVHDRCVPAARQGRMTPPCVQVSLDSGVRDGYVVMKDRRGMAQYLVIPTARVSGIESPSLLKPGAPNYLADAWRARAWVERALGHGMPRGDIALAINSIKGRSQNQLHIHVDCIRGDVRKALDRMLPRIGESWATLPERLAGHPYRGMRLIGRDLRADPVKLLARSLHEGQPMGRQTVVVVGQRFADGREGFLLLSDHSDKASGDWGGGEELLDHQCRIAGTVSVAEQGAGARGSGAGH